ncbi:Phospholipid scramblase family member 5 [Varanus komodoensis]|nr:Phospholipid scramblase family member 5 [Varanus komodoensis]
MRITDNTGREVITVNRPLRCNSCWFPCYLQELEVQSPPGTTVGYVVQKWDPLLPKFTIRDASKEDILKIIGPYATCGCFGDVDFEVKSLNDMSTIGKISKYWSGFVNNIFTNTANFGIQVPADLDVKIKAVMIGACFLLVSIANEKNWQSHPIAQKAVWAAYNTGMEEWEISEKTFTPDLMFFENSLDGL